MLPQLLLLYWMALTPISTLLSDCPRREDIHPCECLEIPKMDANGTSEVETVALCKTIRNVKVLQDAMKGMQGHAFDVIVFDRIYLPPSLDQLFFNVGFGRVDIFNSTVCKTNCW